MYLFQERKLEASTVGTHRGPALFLRGDASPTLQLDLPYPKRPKRLPTVLSRDEVAQLIDSANNLLDYAMLMTLYATDVHPSHLKLANDEPGDHAYFRYRFG